MVWMVQLKTVYFFQVLTLASMREWTLTLSVNGPLSSAKTKDIICDRLQSQIAKGVVVLYYDTLCK